MKRLLYLLPLIAVSLLNGCRTIGLADAPERKIMVGNWTLENIQVEGQEGEFKVELFDEADIECFIGSYWTFTRPNSEGSYILSNEDDCTGSQRDFIWTVLADKSGGKAQFQFKYVAAGTKPKDNKDGYRMDIVSIDESSMTLQGNLTFEGEPLYLVYTFSRDR